MSKNAALLYSAWVYMLVTSYSCNMPSHGSSHVFINEQLTYYSQSNGKDSLNKALLKLHYFRLMAPANDVKATMNKGAHM